jgi:hypothetical protein
VKQEDADFGDIIQFNFCESYRNLTLKTLMGFKWATEFCSNAHFIMKTDDDVYVNINGGTVNIKINIFTSLHCWYGLQINRFCMRISKSTEKH